MEVKPRWLIKICGGGSLGSIVEGGFLLVLFLVYVNGSGMRPRSRLSSQPLTSPAPWVLLRVMVSIPLVPPWVTASRFLTGNREAKLKATTFSSLLSFLLFLSFLFISTFEYCLQRLLNNNNKKNYIYIYIYIRPGGGVRRIDSPNDPCAS